MTPRSSSAVKGTLCDLDFPLFPQAPSLPSGALKAEPACPTGFISPSQFSPNPCSTGPDQTVYPKRH